MSEHSFGKIRPPGRDKAHEALKGQWVEVLEKIDGSQFSFWLDSQGIVRCRSRGRVIPVPCEDKLFSAAANYASTLADRLQMGVVYRGEAMCSNKHNVLSYGRAPKHGMILWAAEYTANGLHANHGTLTEIGDDLDLEVSPLIDTVEYADPACLDDYVKGESMLGGPREGIVAHSPEGVFTKVVCPTFHEVSAMRPMRRKSTDADVADSVGSRYATPARYRKAVQHLRDNGELHGDMRDMKALISRVMDDVEDEEEDAIMAELYKHLKRRVFKAVVRDLGAWYQHESQHGPPVFYEDES